MSFRDFKEDVKISVEGAIIDAGLPLMDFEPSEPPRSEFGDLSVNVAFLIANKLGLSPLDVAKEIGDKIKIPKDSLISSFEVYRPGYINFNVKYPDLSYRSLSEAISKEDYGSLNIGKGKKVCVEHTSVNPNKALHIGHIRNVILGDSIQRILKFTGHDVQVLNYIDDSGLQIADIVVGFKYAGFQLEPPKGQKFDHYCGNQVYVKVNELYNIQPELVIKQKEVLGEIDEGRSDIAKLARDITRKVVKEQLETCWRVGAFYDCLNFESHIIETRLWEKLFNSMRYKGIIQLAKEGKLAGCWVIKMEGEDDEKVIKRSDGTLTYIAKDIPYAAWKIGLVGDPFQYNIFFKQPNSSELWSTVSGKGKDIHPVFGNADLAITVIDVRQSRLQKIISYTLSLLEDEEIEKKYVHLGYEVVSLSRSTADELGMMIEEKDFIHMSGRKGIYINADDVLDVLHKKAYEETKKRNLNESEEWLHNTAEKVAVSALRFDLIKQDLDKIIVFDLRESLNLEGETGPYIQYAYARASSILRKANTELEITVDNASKLDHPTELNLIKLISKFDLYIEDAVKNLSPKILARYAYSLATGFNAFYEKNPVLHEKDENRKMARIGLVQAFRNIVRITFDLLGIETPERI
ncbi:MAG: arginine--tRNA ligase [Candidatus Methylarchaceae archaeon HK02M2]|nr:arginine--tRNA ligase [Candidatus Methylarchaceae archaeon HK02M2]